MKKSVAGEWIGVRFRDRGTLPVRPGFRKGRVQVMTWIFPWKLTVAPPLAVAVILGVTVFRRADGGSGAASGSCPGDVCEGRVADSPAHLPELPPPERRGGAHGADHV